MNRLPLGEVAFSTRCVRHKSDRLHTALHAEVQATCSMQLMHSCRQPWVQGCVQFYQRSK